MIVTEIKNVKINRGCGRNPVFMSWIGTNGGRNYWLFDKNQTEGLLTTSGGDYEPSNIDLETSRGQINDIQIEAQPQLVVYGLIENEDINGLKTILYSPNVERLMNPETWETDGAKWQTYRPAPGSFKIRETDEVRSTFEITFNLAYINTQSQ